MAQKTSRFQCHPVTNCCGGLFLGIILTSVVLGIYGYYSGTFQEYLDQESCFQINRKESFILPLPNVSAFIGKEVTVECKVLNFGFENQKVFWNGPNFHAETASGAVVKTHKEQAGVTVLVMENDESFQCSSFLPLNETVTVRTLTFRLTIYIRGDEHEGLYTCATNYTVHAALRDDGIKLSGAHVSSSTFYIDVE